MSASSENKSRLRRGIVHDTARRNLYQSTTLKEQPRKSSGTVDIKIMERVDGLRNATARVSLRTILKQLSQLLNNLTVFTWMWPSSSKSQVIWSAG